MIETEVNNLRELKRSLVLNIQDTNLELGNVYKKSEDAKKDLASLLEQIAGAKNLLSSIEKEIKDSKNRASFELSAIGDSKNALLDEILGLEAQQATLQNRINLSSDSIVKLEKRKTDLESKVGSMRTELESKKGEHVSTTSDIVSAKAEKQALLSEINQLKSDIQDIQNKHAQDTRKRQQEIDALDVELVKKQTHFINFKDSQGDYVARLKEWESNLGVLERRLLRHYGGLNQTFKTNG